MSDNDYPTLEELRRLALAENIDISNKTHQRAINERRAFARQLAIQDRATETDVENDKWYTTIRDSIVKAGGILTVSLTLALSAFLPPIATIGLAIVEIERVAAGVALFDEQHALLMAIVVIFAYLILLIIHADMSFKEYGTLERKVSTLRAFVGNFIYWLGYYNQQGRRSTTPLQRVERAISSLSLIIIILGTLGSMAGMIATLEGAWWQGAMHIFTSDLLTFTTFIGGFMFTAGLLVAMEFIISYIYRQYRKLLPDTDEIDTSLDEHQAEYDYLWAQVEKTRAKQAAKEATQEPVKEPEPFLLHSSNGNGHRGNGAAADAGNG